MIKILLSLIFAVSFPGFSQSIPKKIKPKDTIPYEMRYNKLKELKLKQKSSQTQLAADSLFQVFVYKITPELSLNEIKVERFDYLPWVKENLSKTEFKDMAEAEKLWNEYNDAINRNIEENKEYYDYLHEVLSFEGGIELSGQVIRDVAMENRDKIKRVKLPKRKKKSDFYPKLPGQ